MCTPSPLLPRSTCGAGNSILKNEITHISHNLVSVQDHTAMLSCCSYTRMQKMPKEKKESSLWYLDTRKAEYCFSLSQSSGISTAGCKTQWWEQVCMLWETTITFLSCCSTCVLTRTLQAVWMRNPLPVPKYPPTALSAHCQTVPRGSALGVLNPVLPQPFSLQIWRTTQNLALMEG